MTWQAFVLRYGHGQRVSHLAAIVGQPAAAIAAVRHTRRAVRGPRRSYVQLFQLFHGRAPQATEWPVPTKVGGGYEWLPPELTLLASLVGRMAKPAIVQTLTARLRQVTGDPTAERDGHAVQGAINRIGLQVRDVVGGVTITQAAQQIGQRQPIWNAIEAGKLRAIRVGQIYVIPHDAWAAWKAARVFPPAGYVLLRVLKGPLGIKSDKLSEFARAGKIPTAVRCNPYGTRGPSTQFGTWWLDPKVARKIIADRRAGRPMPWHGTPDLHNLTVTYRRWRQRQHPPRCPLCQQIWGRAGAPQTFDEYLKRYPRLAFGAKRHLTKPYSDGLTLGQVARTNDVSVYRVATAVRTGNLAVAHVVGRTRFISKVAVQRWKCRRCPTGKAEQSLLAIPTAAKLYAFTPRELERRIRRKELIVTLGTNGPQRGQRLLQKQQVRELRDRIGYSETDAARRARVSVSRLRVLLRGLQWRKAGAGTIPLDVINAVIHRKHSRSGDTIAEAARRLQKPVAWVRQQLYAGTFRVLRTKWNKSRRYVSAPMLKRLARAARQPARALKFSRNWIRLSEAADLGGVSTGTVQRWIASGWLTGRPGRTGQHFHTSAVKAAARRHWRTLLKKRTFRDDRRPAWLLAEAA